MKLRNMSWNVVTGIISLVLIFAVISCAPDSAHAAPSPNISASGLTQEQINAINEQIEEMKEKSVNDKVYKQVSKWSELGTNIGSALVATAAQVGVEVNKFAATPLGMITTGVIVYKIIGRDILILSFGSMLIIVGLILATYFMCNARNREYSYHQTTYLWGMFQINHKKLAKTGGLDSDWVGMSIVSLIATVVITLGMIISL
jgi:hypothetical protein